jgi:hypothetical protein
MYLLENWTPLARTGKYQPLPFAGKCEKKEDKHGQKESKNKDTRKMRKLRAKYMKKEEIKVTRMYEA